MYFSHYFYHFLLIGLSRNIDSKPIRKSQLKRAEIQELHLIKLVQHVCRRKSSVATTPFNSHFNVLIGFSRGWFSVPPLIFKFPVRKILFKFLGCVQLWSDTPNEAGTIYVNLSTPSNGILTRLQSPFNLCFKWIELRLSKLLKWFEIETMNVNQSKIDTLSVYLYIAFAAP